jgi:hypothetical protein
MAAGPPEPPTEPQLNRLLRQVDWRFLLHCRDLPRVADLTSGRYATALELIAAETAATPGTADLAVIGFPTSASLRAALEALRPGGEVVSIWRMPRPGGAGRARARLRGAGFADVRAYWPGPVPHRPPQFWLPLDSRDAKRFLLAERPARNPLQAALRLLWGLAARAGLLVPACAVARAPGDPGAAEARSERDALFSDTPSWLLLTGGKRSINKVVGVPFPNGGPQQASVVKFARTAEADAPLDREAEALRLIERSRPAVSGVPRLLAGGRRAGRRALAETAIHGGQLIAELSPATFADLASRVTAWLVELAGDQQPRPREEWWERLVGEPLTAFERDFGPVAEPGTAARARGLLGDLGDLPLVPEHRDCSPWNIVITADGRPALLDWESAEPRGLPGLDLAYFLANAGFVMEGALESGRTRDSLRRLLDAQTGHGRVAARCVDEYCAALGLDPDAFARLRLLAWIVHSLSDFRHLAMEAAGRPTPRALRESLYLGLIEEEIRRREAGRR